MEYVANSLMAVQALYGTIPKIYGKGTLSKVHNASNSNFWLQILN